MAASTLPIPHVSIEDALGQLGQLKVERDAAWHSINPIAPPSLTNDWATFAVASGKYLKFYRFTHDGREPEEPDQVEIKSTEYWNKFIAKMPGSAAPPKTDEQRNKGNERRHAVPQFQINER